MPPVLTGSIEDAERTVTNAINALGSGLLVNTIFMIFRVSQFRHGMAPRARWPLDSKAIVVAVCLLVIVRWQRPL